MRTNKLKKVIMIAVAAAMLIAMVPASVFADGTMKVTLEVDRPTRAFRNDTIQVTAKASADGNLPYKLVFIPGDKDLSVSTAKTGIYQGTDSNEFIFSVNILKGASVGNHEYAIRAVDPEDETIIYAKKSFSLMVEQGEDVFSSMGSMSFDLSYDIDGSDTLVAGEEHTIKFYLYNRSDNTARNTTVSIKLPTGVTIKGGTDRVNVGYFSGYKTATAEFKVIADKTIVNGNYGFQITASGTVNSNEGGTSTPATKSDSQTVYIPITGGKDKADDDADTDTDKLTPILMVSSYSYGDSAVVTGKDFNLGLTLKNTNSEKDMYNIKATVDAGGVFIPVGSSNSFYIEEIKAGASAGHSIKMNCSQDATQAPHSITVSMSYQDADGKSYTASDSISVPVVGEVRFKVDEILDPGWLTADSQAYLSVTYYNLGKSTLSNMTIKAEGDFTLDGSNTYFVGNMNAGKSDYYNLNFWPLGEGPCNGKITFTFEDAAGEEHVVEKEFTFNIGPAMVWDEPGMDYDDYEEPQTGMPTWAWIAIGVAAAIVVLIVVKKIIKKRKAKKQEALELDE